MGRPVARSQTTVVSRWFVIPMAAIRSPGDARGLEGPLHGVEDALPDLGGVVLDQARFWKVLGNSRVALPTVAPDVSMTSAVEPVVP